MPRYSRRYSRYSRSYSRSTRRGRRNSSRYSRRKSYSRGVTKRVRRFVSNYVAKRERLTHGRQVRQRLDAISTYSNSPNALTMEWGLWPPINLNTSSILTSESDEKIMMHQMSQHVYLTNESNVPIIIKRMKYKARVDTQESVTATLGDNAPSILLPYTDYTTSQAFRRNYKILSMKTYIVKPGAVRIFKQKMYSKGGHVFTGDVEGNSANFYYRGGYGMYFTIVSGPHTEVVSGGSTGDVGPVSIAVAVARCQLASYYIMEDNDPSTTTTNSSISQTDNAYAYGADGLVNRTGHTFLQKRESTFPTPSANPAVPVISV